MHPTARAKRARPPSRRCTREQGKRARPPPLTGATPRRGICHNSGHSVGGGALPLHGWAHATTVRTRGRGRVPRPDTRGHPGVDGLGHHIRVRRLFCLCVCRLWQQSARPPLAPHTPPHPPATTPSTPSRLTVTPGRLGTRTLALDSLQKKAKDKAEKKEKKEKKAKKKAADKGKKEKGSPSKAKKSSAKKSSAKKSSAKKSSAKSAKPAPPAKKEGPAETTKVSNCGWGLGVGALPPVCCSVLRTAPPRASEPGEDAAPPPRSRGASCRRDATPRVHWWARACSKAATVCHVCRRHHRTQRYLFTPNPFR